MRLTPDDAGPRATATQVYTVAVLASLFVVTVALLADGLRLWSLVPAALGLLGLAGRWRTAPGLVLLSLAAFVPLHGAGIDPLGLLAGLMTLNRNNFYSLMPRRLDGGSVAHLPLAVGLVGYLVGHYRLMGLTRNAFPPDPRVPKKPSPAEAKRAQEAATLKVRPAAAAEPWEVVSLVASALVWPAAGFVVFVALWSSAPPLELGRTAWRFVAVVLGFGTVAVVLGLAMWYGRIRRYTRAEATQVLHDVVWHETRREQGLIQRWVYGARLRRDRAEGGDA